MYFVFAAIWAFGGALVEKDGTDYRRRFDKWWKGTWTTVKMPGAQPPLPDAAACLTCPGLSARLQAATWRRRCCLRGR